MKELKTDMRDIRQDELIDPEVGAQKVEHYEIATYGSACALAKLMDNK
jgi:ferritin-like metal-binding protein YciE